MKNEKQIGEYYRRKQCRFGGERELVTILDLGEVPLAGAFLKEEDFPKEKYYPLTLEFCPDSCLVQVANVVPGEVLFKEHYFYFSSAIKTLVAHCTDFARETKERFLQGVAKPAVFEIGCNDGVMLKPLADLGIKAVGVDPATNVVKSVDQTNFTIVNDFFGERVGKQVLAEHGKFDAILSSYSFAHIDDMFDIMRGVKTLLKDEGVLIFEVYYLGTLIDDMQYDMIYHEHMSYYSLRALSYFLKKFDMEIFDVKYTPGVRSGAVRFYARNIGKRKEPISPAVQEMVAYEEQRGFDKVETFLDYGAKVAATRTALIQLLDELKSEGQTIIGYGASGRGTTIMNYCGIDTRYLDYVVDDAPAKHGYYTPGTHVVIQPWEHTTKGKRPDYALLFAWSFIDEVKKRRADYLEQGGRFIVPLPQVQVAGK